jgi:hypothetical protein
MASKATTINESRRGDACVAPTNGCHFRSSHHDPGVTTNDENGRRSQCPHRQGFGEGQRGGSHSPSGLERRSTAANALFGENEAKRSPSPLSTPGQASYTKARHSPGVDDMLKSLRRPLKQVRVPQYRYECPVCCWAGQIPQTDYNRNVSAGCHRRPATPRIGRERRCPARPAATTSILSPSMS